MVGEEVLSCLAGVEETRGLWKWVRRFPSSREFEASWDGKVRGVGGSSKGVPQGSPLSPVLFLVWMASILRELERRIIEEVPSVVMEFPYYVYDLHYGSYAGRRILVSLNEVGRREGMEDLLDRVTATVKEVAIERSLPHAEDKDERLVLRDRNGRRGRRRVVERVKWLVVIVDED